MPIVGQELEKEKLILKKVSKLVNNELEKLGKEVKVSNEDLVEFKKVIWSDFSSFDDGDIVQARNMTTEAADKTLQKEKYFSKLSKIHKKPYFASIVFKDEEGDIFNIYIALTYLKDSKLNNILYDWRSPVCSLFYDFETGPCSYKAPGGLISGQLLRKRQYKIEDNKLISVFDNSLNINDEVLQEVLATNTSEKMKNIVNTIQKEQNQVIRNLDDKNVIVQGIAGSGKTSVALHRIAYLLYQIDNLTSNNIIIFSPNNIFSEYISNVLPELGEANTLETTFNNYLSYFINEYKDVETFANFILRYYSYEEVNFELVKYKQSDVIINDLDCYLEDYIANAKFINDIEETKYHFTTLEELQEMLTYKYNRLPLFERLDEIALKLSNNFYKGSDKKANTFRKLIDKSINFKKDFKEIYRNFFTSSYCRIKLSDSEIKDFIDKDIINYEDSLLFTYLKGSLNGFLYEANIKQVVIDEAQDYNKLQYIIISKIFKKADFTILGDVNQNINPYYKWKSLNELSSVFEDSKYIELLKTYRSSSEIVEYTNKILNLSHTSAIRKANNLPVVFRKKYESLKKSLISDLKVLQNKYKTVALITKDKKEANKLYSLLKDQIKFSLIDDDTTKFYKNLIVVPAYLSKGLEFDAVIVYNNRENSYKKNERNLLYVACTRAQHELYIYN